MKLNNDTLTILKNFATINPGIEFKAGSKLSTIAPSKTMLAKATLKDTFPEDFCVYDLNQFLTVFSMFKDADVDLEFDEHNIIFRSGKSQIKYRKTSKNMIVTVPEKDVKLTSTDISLTLKESDLAEIMKSASVLQSPNIAIESDGDQVYLKCFNAKDDSAHTNSVIIDSSNGVLYSMVFLVDNLKMISGTYNVDISSKGLAHFMNTNVDIEYWIAIESKDSKYKN